MCVCVCKYIYVYICTLYCRTWLSRDSSTPRVFLSLNDTLFFSPNPLRSQPSSTPFSSTIYTFSPWSIDAILFSLSRFLFFFFFSFFSTLIPFGFARAAFFLFLSLALFVPSFRFFFFYLSSARFGLERRKTRSIGKFLFFFYLASGIFSLLVLLFFFFFLLFKSRC